MKSMLPFLLSAALVSAGAQTIKPAALPKLATVDPRFQSYNVEMVEVIGGRFWKPYGSTVARVPTSTSGNPGGLDPGLFEQRRPIDLTNPRLRKLAAALGPAYMRVSGTWANTVYFQDDDRAPLSAPPAGFGGVLTRAEWKNVVQFAQAVDARLVTSFSTGAGTRDAHGLWTPAEARKFLDYNKSIGGTIAGAEFMNEPTFANMAGAPAGYDGPAYGRDFAVFQPFLRQASPQTLILGPGSVGEGIDLAGSMKLLPSTDLLAGMGANPVDAFSYHFYGAVSERCAPGGAGGTRVTDALSEDWLQRSGKVESFYAGLRDKYAPGKPMWLTETGQTACGGDRWAATFADSFRYLDQMGQLARRGVQVVMHNTLAASDYGLIDEHTLLPRPNYWAALLWHRTMGTVVLDAGASPLPSVHVYAGCMKDHPGGVTMMALNLGKSGQKLNLQTPAQRYTLTAAELTSGTVKLNGKELMLTADGDLPGIAGEPAPSGDVQLPPESITFATLPAAGNGACR